MKSLAVGTCCTARCVRAHQHPTSPSEKREEPTQTLLRMRPSSGINISSTTYTPAGTTWRLTICQQRGSAPLPYKYFVYFEGLTCGYLSNTKAVRTLPRKIWLGKSGWEPWCYDYAAVARSLSLFLECVTCCFIRCCCCARSMLALTDVYSLWIRSLACPKFNRTSPRLRLRLAGGEFELVRRVLWQLRDALGKELLHCTTTTAADNNNNSSRGTPHGSHGVTATSAAAALANYSEATEMLAVQIMLPCGESGEASALVANDRYLGANDKGRLLKACELSAARTQEEVGEPGTRVDGAGRATTRATSSRASGGGNGNSQPHPGSAGRAASGRPEGDGHARFGEHFDPPDPGAGRRGPEEQQGPVQKFFSDVSDWTPEARIQLVVGAGAAGLAAYAALRNRDSLWRAARGAASAAARTAGDIGAFIVGSS